MKLSLIRGIVMFFAGAGCATVVAGLYPPIEPITQEQFQDRLTAAMIEVEALGGYVGLAENGRIGIYTNVGACIPPVPIPKWPAHAVDQRSLENGGHEAVFHTGSSRTVDTLRRSDFDLVLMDVNMPDTEGVDVVKRIRGAADVSFTKIMFYSTMDMEALRAAAARVGHVPCLQKPSTQRDLLRKVDEALSA